MSLVTPAFAMSELAGRDIRRRKGSKHDRTGCLTCRYRRKKCVENTFPSCGACIRLNLECVREPKHRVVPSNSSVNKTIRAHRANSPLDSEMDRPLCVQNDDISSKRRYAMRYYVTVLTQLLTVSQQYNSFLSAFLPMAMESQALADSLVAWASGHLSASDDRYAITALEARSTSLSALSKSISIASDITYHETNTATCLVLLTSEVCLGNYAGWYNHLTGAKHIIQSACKVAGSQVVHGPDAFKHSAEGQWVLRNFAYHDVLGSVTLGTKPLIHADYLEGITDVVDSYIGVASQLLVFISEISSLDTSSGSQLQQDFATIETNLQSWHCHVDSTPALAAVAYTYRSAALIYLYRQIRKYLRLNNEPLPNIQTKLIELDSKIQTEVFNTLIHISNLSPSGIPDSALLFPLFLAGGEAREGCHVHMIRLLLRLMLEKRPFHNIISALGILEEVWNRRMRSSGDEIDWEHIVKCQGGGLLLT